MRTKVITARIDDQASFQIEFLKRHLHLPHTTQVLLRAISSLYGAVKEKEAQKTPFELLEELELIGCLEGEKDLSQNYKKVLSESLQAKHSSKKSRAKKDS